MSFIRDLNQNLANIDIYLDRYKKFIEDNKPFFIIEGVKLETVCKRLPGLAAEFRIIGVELKSMSGYLEFRRETTEGELWKKYIEGSKRHMAPKDIQMYSKQDPDIIMLSELILEVDHLRLQIAECVEALNMLHWQLSNITKIRIASLEESVL